MNEATQRHEQELEKQRIAYAREMDLLRKALRESEDRTKLLTTNLIDQHKIAQSLNN